MAIIGNNADTFLNGLSDFWHRFFKDIGDIQAAYEGTAVLLGQAYLDLLNDVLNLAVNETPLFKKEYYKLIAIREDQVTYRDTGSLASSRSVFRPPDTLFVQIPQLQNKVFNPTAAMEDATDYTLNNGELRFLDDPTDPVEAGYANRQIDVLVGGYFSAPLAVGDLRAAGVKKGDLLYISVTDDLRAGVPSTLEPLKIVHVAPGKVAVSKDTPLPVFPAGFTPTAFSWHIRRIRADGTVVSVVTSPAPASSADPREGRLEYNTTLRVTEVSFWCVDAHVDDGRLYRLFGHLFGSRQASTEAYRAFIRGLMQLYVFGPAIDRVESALTVAANLPVIRDDAETLVSYASGLDGSGTAGDLSTGGQLEDDVFFAPAFVFLPGHTGGYLKITDAFHAANIGNHRIEEFIDSSHVRLTHARGGTFITENAGAPLTWEFSLHDVQTIITNKHTYEYARDIPVRADVREPTSAGVLTFRAFEPLTTAIQVIDYIKDPEWWHRITMPAEVMPGKSAGDRVVTNQVYPLIVGPAGAAKIGDAGFFIGADEAGVLPSGGSKPFRHQANFILFDRFLKAHMFGILIDPGVDLTGVLINDLQRIIKEVKPAHTVAYFRPITGFLDSIQVAEEILQAKARMLIIESFALLMNDAQVGGGWMVGSSFAFAGASGGAVNISNASPPPTGYCAYAVGGHDPLIQLPDPGPCVGDRALHVIARSAV